jgi:hypothetical protein
MKMMYRSLAEKLDEKRTLLTNWWGMPSSVNERWRPSATNEKYRLLLRIRILYLSRAQRGHVKLSGLRY